MATTLRTIADELNISTTLVSCVLNNKPGVWASDTTRARIIETASRLDYRPSMAARALATGKSMLLAVSSADSSWHQARLERMTEMRGLIDAAEHHHYGMLVLPSSGARASKAQFEKLVRSNGCDGFCLCAEQAGAEIYEFLRGQQMPFVVIGDPGEAVVPRVDHDNFSFMRESVLWIAREGRRRIGWISPPPLPGEDPAGQHYARRLAQGYKAGIKKSGCAVDANLVAQRDWQSADEMIAWVRETKPDALILRGLTSILQWKFALLGAGLRVPQDILLMAQLNLPELGYLEQALLHEGLACHVYDPHAVGEKAGELLINWINGKPAPQEAVFVAGQPPRWC